eukprot:361838-Chlamydomonas_euryale.AAC.2
MWGAPKCARQLRTSIASTNRRGTFAIRLLAGRRRVAFSGGRPPRQRKRRERRRRRGRVSAREVIDGTSGVPQLAACLREEARGRRRESPLERIHGIDDEIIDAVALVCLRSPSASLPRRCQVASAWHIPSARQRAKQRSLGAVMTFGRRVSPLPPPLALAAAVALLLAGGAVPGARHPSAGVHARRHVPLPRSGADGNGSENGGGDGGGGSGSGGGGGDGGGGPLREGGCWADMPGGFAEEFVQCRELSPEITIFWKVGEGGPPCACAGCEMPASAAGANIRAWWHATAAGHGAYSCVCAPCMLPHNLHALLSQSTLHSAVSKAILKSNANVV